MACAAQALASYWRCWPRLVAKAIRRRQVARPAGRAGRRGERAGRERAGREQAAAAARRAEPVDLAPAARRAEPVDLAPAVRRAEPVVQPVDRAARRVDRPAP